jgi:large subunit ribosomal protein L19e
VSRSKKRVAAEILKVGVNRVRFDPEDLERIESAVTRQDIRRLIHSGSIWAEQEKGISSGRRKLKAMKKKLRGRGPGTKKGAKTSRMPRKEVWMRQVRVLRRYLRRLKERGELPPEQQRSLYKKVKGGEIRTLRRLKEVIEESRSR